jgi:hypothetical protein
VGISGELNLDVARGNVLLQRTSGPVIAVILAGDVQLFELQGALGQGKGPLIAIEANGNIHLSAGAKSPAAPN